MSSRFWTKGYQEDEMLEVEEAEDNTQAAKYLPHDDSEPSRQKRGVKPMKEEISEEMTYTIGQMKNAMKINDWTSLHGSFDKINKQLEKVVRVVDSVPNVYIKALIMLQDFLNQTLASKVMRWKTSASNAKALNSMKLKLKKKNKQYEELINKYKENPDVSEEEDWEVVEDPMKLDCDWDEDEDEEKDDEEDDEWENIMSGKTKLVDNPFQDSSKLTWDMVTQKFKEIVAEKQEKKGAGRIKLLEQGKKGMGRIFVEPSELSTRVHILSRDVNYSYIYYHK